MSVPRTEWQNKPKTQTVYDRQITTRYVTTPQLVYAPVATYAMTQTLRGLWNPFRSPYYTYRYQPVTAWQPTIQNQAIPVTTEKWVPRQQTVYVPELVQKTEVTQQVVTTEVPAYGQNPQTLYANQPAPRLRIPILARQQVLPPSILASSPVSLAATTRPLTPPIASTTRLRSVGSATSTLSRQGYAAPLRTASAAPARARDTIQTGMSATVLR